jgi:ABC-2 type transport system ATP-binding protein
MNKKNVLIAKNVNKIYSKNTSNAVKALDNLNLEVKEGEIFGLLGPNGAGKSTFINILGGTVIKSSGYVNVWGFDIDKNPRQVKASIGIVPQETNIDPFFTPYELLELNAGLYGIKKKDRITNTILKLVALDKQSGSYSRGLSGGMKRRLLVAKALVHQPPIIILDEPTAGVDVELRKNLWENIRLLNKQGVTIILTTHYLEEAEKMCDRIGILNKGTLVALDSTKNLIDRIQYKKVAFKLNSKVGISIKDFNSLNIISSNENELIVSYDKSKLSINEIISFLNKQDVKILDISTEDGDLEDVFVRLTKN